MIINQFTPQGFAGYRTPVRRSIYKILSVPDDSGHGADEDDVAGMRQ